MDKSIVLEILGLLEATPAVLVVAGIGFIFSGIVFVLVAWLHKRIKCMEKKYHALDKDNVRLWDRLYPGEIKDHHSGDYFHPPNRE